jgi:dihydropteroate synthase
MSLNKLLNKKRTLIMGVMNLTPDSFSGDGRAKNAVTANLRFAKDLVRSGCDIIDLGGESSRPGALEISPEEEIRRVLPTLKLIIKHLNVPVSIDTYKSQVADVCLKEGASIINNIKGTMPDPVLLKTIAACKAYIVLMHMRGNAKTMQTKTSYKDVVADVHHSIGNSIEICLEMGIKKDRIIIDPGIGFAKTAKQNLKLLNRLDEFKDLNCPVLIGTSRKSFIGQVINADVNNRCWGTAATVAVAISKGARIIRVHDIASMKQVAAMTDAIIQAR